MSNDFSVKLGKHKLTLFVDVTGLALLCARV